MSERPSVAVLCTLTLTQLLTPTSAVLEPLSGEAPLTASRCPSTLPGYDHKNHNNKIITAITTTYHLTLYNL